MPNIVPFDFNGNQVRVFEDEHGDPWFVAKDVCEVLGLKQGRSSVALLDEEDKSGVYTVDAISRRQRLVTISESGLYELIFQSRIASARRFQKWVTKQVLPQIRKTGAYAPTDHQKLLQRYVLVEPDEWTKRFPDLFYEFLAELTKQSIPQLPKRGRPPLWAALTKRWIYDRLPHEIGQALEQSRNADDCSRYLHTHLTPDGIELFKSHMAQLTTIMQGSSSWHDVDRILANIDAYARQMELRLK